MNSFQWGPWQIAAIDIRSSLKMKLFFWEQWLFNLHQGDFMTTQNGDRNVLTHLLIIFSNSLLNLDFGRPNMQLHSLLKSSGRPKPSVRFDTSAGTLFRVVSVLRRESHFGKTYRTELKHYKNHIFFKKMEKMAEIFWSKMDIFKKKKIYFRSVCLFWRFSERCLRLN